LTQALVIALLELVLRQPLLLLEDLRIAFGDFLLERQVLPVELHVCFLLADALLLLLLRDTLVILLVAVLVLLVVLVFLVLLLLGVLLGRRIVGPVRPRDDLESAVRSGPA
jgi:hypothetical protein